VSHGWGGGQVAGETGHDRDPVTRPNAWTTSRPARRRPCPATKMMTLACALRHEGMLGLLVGLVHACQVPIKTAREGFTGECFVAVE
jgi:hypothetical protein